VNRKQRRAQQKKLSKPEEELSRKVVLFGKIPDACLICQKPFDKKDKNMVISWKVVVHSDTETVRLFCPKCVDETKEFIEENES